MTGYGDRRGRGSQATHAEAQGARRGERAGGRTRHRRVAHQGEDDRQVPGLGYTVRRRWAPARSASAQAGRDVETASRPSTDHQGEGQDPAEIRRPRKPRSGALATDPDREARPSRGTGEPALERRQGAARPVPRDTKDAVAHALAHPLDMTSGKSTRSRPRRVLDRLVGYKTSPLLWKSIKTGLSRSGADRSAAVICEREERSASSCRRSTGPRGRSREGRPGVPGAAAQARGEKAGDQRRGRPAGDRGGCAPSSLQGRAVEKASAAPAPPPFRTSTLQQERRNSWAFPRPVTMRIAQQLVRSIESRRGAGGADHLHAHRLGCGWRTRPSPRHATTSRRNSEGLFAGRARGPQGAEQHAGAGRARAIRPTDVPRRPDDLKQHLELATVQAVPVDLAALVASQIPRGVRDHEGRLRSGPLRVPGHRSRVLFDATTSCNHEAHEPEEGKTLDDLPPIPPLEQATW